jgi:hypothetical protein
MTHAAEFLASVKIPLEEIERHLGAAEALIPKDTLKNSGIADDLCECREDGYNHFWMVELQRLGKWLEDRKEDSLLPVEYWHHLALAATQMELDPFIPFFAGKAARKPKRDWYDMMASIVVLQRGLPKPLQTEHPDVCREMDRYVGFLEGLHPSHPALFESPKLIQLRSRFSDGKYLEKDPPDEAMTRINEDFMAMFDGIFDLATDPALPEQLHDAAWSIIDVNTFVVVVGSGMMPLTEAEVWWRT